MRTSSRRAGLVLALVCLLAVPSCVTAALWDDSCRSSCHRWSDLEVAGRVLLTPFALVADAVLISVYVGAHCGQACR